ncbi:MAG: restriction endonuclease subunit S [Methylococcaceae bacterium]|nr:restriction endonuclease subunit S [Methylococcaceae bacterium]
MMELKAGYKQTEVGVIPSDWFAKKISSFAEICTGNTPPTNDLNNYGHDYLFVTPADLGTEKTIRNTQKKLSSKGFNISRKYPKNTILFTCIGSTIGKCGISDKELTSNQQINAIFPNDFFDSDYLYYFLNLFSDRIKKMAGETAVPIINKTDFGEISITFPPTKTEQTAIATALNDADQLITQLEQLIAKKRNIKQGVMQALLKPKADWDTKKLGWIGSFKGGNGFPTKAQGEKNQQVPFYKVSDMNLLGNEIFMTNSNNWISEKIVNDIGAHCFPSNTIVFAKIGAAIFLERKKILSMVSCIDNNMMGFVVDIHTNDLRFIYFLFHSMKISLYANTTALPSINGKDLSDIDVKVPKKPEQTQIAQILTNMDTELQALEQKLAKYRMLKQGMMQTLLTGKTRLVKPNSN